MDAAPTATAPPNVTLPTVNEPDSLVRGEDIAWIREVAVWQAELEDQAIDSDAHLAVEHVISILSPTMAPVASCLLKLITYLHMPDHERPSQGFTAPSGVEECSSDNVTLYSLFNEWRNYRVYAHLNLAIN